MFNRIRNLWKLSKYEPSEKLMDKFIETHPQKDITLLVKKGKFNPAKVIDMSPEVDLDEPLEADEKTQYEKK